jgi:RNA polymerase sigma-70 factor (ECF subfamily)
VFRVASRFFRQREIVEEAAQEVFLKIYTQLGSFEERGSFEGWLTRIAHNTCINMLRTAKRRPQSIEPDVTEDETAWLERKVNESTQTRQPSVEDNLIAADLAEKLLNTLSADDRTALTLMDGEELSVKEVAQMTGWSESKVKIRAMRARQRMRQAVENLFRKN